MARALLMQRCMLKTLVSTSALLFLLCGPALADPTRGPTTAFDLGFVVSTGAQARYYAIKLVDDTCGSVMHKDSGKTEDTIDVCVRAGSQVKLEIDWSTRDGQRELRNRSTVIAKRGASFDLQGGGAKLGVTVK